MHTLHMDMGTRSTECTACGGSSVFSMVGFLGGPYGIIGGVSGVLACVASSIIMCCGPRSTEEGGCKFTTVRELSTPFDCLAHQPRLLQSCDTPMPTS